jgi:hypothetical protein
MLLFIMVLISFRSDDWIKVSLGLGYLRDAFGWSLLRFVGINKTWRKALPAVSFAILIPKGHYTFDLVSQTPCCSGYSSCSPEFSLPLFPSPGFCTTYYTPPTDCPYTYFISF